MFKLDVKQIEQHLTALGYKTGDTVYLRSFYPSEDPRKTLDKGRSAEVRNLKQLTRTVTAWQSDGRGVYIVINGGGHSDKDVTNCRAIFYEHDNLDKELQKELWRSLGLPEPSLQIDTGGKSIHSYWILDSFVDPVQWKQLQTDLLEYADADRALKNPSRVMRLAGCWHFGANNLPNGQSQIILNTNKRYSYEELRAIVPVVKPVTIPASAPELLSDDIPLYQCLSKSDRSLIDSGAGQGERNSQGAKLARNLIGTANRLTYLGHRYSGDPRSLFDDYSCRCSPALDTREADSIWKSAQKDNPTATLTDEALENCIKSWQRQQSANFQQTRVNDNKTTTVTGDSAKSGDGSNPEHEEITSIVTSVTRILKAGLTDYEETQRLEELLSSTVVTKAAFWQIVSSVKTQLDEVQPSDEIRLESLINWHDAQLDFYQALPSMAADLIHDAEILNVEPIVIWQPLLSAVLSLVGKRIKLDVESHSVPAIAWTATVLESGGGKTRADSLVLTPLKRRQIEARRKYEQEVEAYQNSQGDAEERPPYPVERKYMFEMATIQAVIKRLSEQKDNGVLWARDELAGLFKSFGQFSKGENEGLECLLKLWDGAPAQVDRVSQVDSYVVEETALSLTGGIQPGVFRKIFSDPDDSQGMLARFLVAKASALMPRRVKGYCVLSDKLPNLYDWLENSPMGTVKLSNEADAYYTKLCTLIGHQAWETTQPAIRAWMFKLPTQLLRIALALHLLECYSNRQLNFWQLQIETLKRAVLFAQYYRSAFHVVQEITTQSDDISSVLLKIWDAAVTKYADGISTRDAYRNIKAIQERAKQAFRSAGAYAAELFAQLERMGKGTVVKIGRQIKFVAKFNHTPQPTPPISTVQIQQPTGDSVTIPQILEPLALELSPTMELSPATITDTNISNVVLEITEPIPPQVLERDGCVNVKDERNEQQELLPLQQSVAHEPPAESNSSNGELIQVGSIVAHSDIYCALYKAKGEVIDDLGEEVWVAWEHWKDKPKKTDRYFKNELRLLDQENETVETTNNLSKCTQALRESLALGADAIKSTLSRWASNLRWQVVLELEALAREELQAIAGALPQFYDWLSEDVLPVEG